MIRPSTALFAAAVILVGYAMFQVKYEVQQQEETLTRLNRQIGDSREAVRVLDAEWSFLTQPARLAELAKRYLALTPIGVAQLGTIAAIPLRNPEAQAAPTPPTTPALPQAARPVPPHPPAGARAEFATFKTSTAR
jgi:hypothetical protein